MTRLASEVNRNPTNLIPAKDYNPKDHHHHHHHQRYLSFFSPKHSLILLATCVSLFVLFHVRSLQTHPPQPLPFTHQWKNTIINTTTTAQTFNICPQEAKTKSMAAKLRRSVTFLPLKDLRYTQTAQQGHTWFMSSAYDTHEEGEVQYQHFPSEASNGRLLCVKGNDTHDGAWNSYALAWPEFLPYNSTLVKGLTFVSYNHYNYDNIWHGLSAMVPFVAWHIKGGCLRLPSKWVLYHWGELRTKMGPWVRSLMEATFSGSVEIERFDPAVGEENEDGAACFEEAVVMRHNEGGMSRQKRMEVYDLMRCKAREYCNVSTRVAEVGGGRSSPPAIGMTMFMRTGARSFRNNSAVIGIFERECRKIEGCRLMVAYSNNLTFCEQVKLMSLTDVLVSPHGAQLTNMFLMDRNSSVMEFFPRGWLKLAGVGQYVFHWIASWSGMKHQGAWRDASNTDPRCPYDGEDDDRRCMSIYKNAKIGHNQTFFALWARNVLAEVKLRKMEEASSKQSAAASATNCACG